MLKNCGLGFPLQNNRNFSVGSGAYSVVMNNNRHLTLFRVPPYLVAVDDRRDEGGAAAAAGGHRVQREGVVC